MILPAVRDLIIEQEMILPGDTVVAAVSGGADSMAQLHILVRIREQMDFSIHVAHLDHMFRGEESRRDAVHVRALAEQLGLPYTIEAIDVPDYMRSHSYSSAQEAARVVRYAFLHETASALGASSIAVAHNADDQVETVLHHFMRGAGSEGLRGMRYVSGLLIRPMLDISRAEIEEYCRNHHISYRQDSSNASLRYTRNRIRAELLPLMESFNPAVRDALRQTARLMAADDDCLDAVAAAGYEDLRRVEQGRIHLSEEGLTSLDICLKRRVLRMAIAELAGSVRDITMAHIEDLLSLVDGRVGSSLDLPGITAYRDYQSLILSSGRVIASPVNKVYELSVPGDTLLPEIGLRLRAFLDEGRGQSPVYGQWKLSLDADSLPGPLRVRFRRPGDRIFPVGMEGSKKLHDLFVDAKIPRWQREEIPILAAGDEVVWAIGIRADRRWLSGPESARIIRLQADVLEREQA